ncbi:unnamed protein product [Aureobasidium mustum]|uniref:Uncharacterized protein n=1 Tax=Aureobasidium mustum TaxID=2773714 RepID=A0A9N8JN77_9PEZI|nr:unnamed protein product [Aureobasidium mustum]
MSETLPHSVSIAAGPSSKLSDNGGVVLQTAVLTTEDVVQQQTTKPTTTDYGEPSATSCLSLGPRKLTRRFTKFIRSKRHKTRGGPPPEYPIQSSDRDSNELVRISEPELRGRRTTARLPLGVNRLPLLYDDGQGSWTGEFGYIYSGGMDFTRSRLSLSFGGNAGPAPPPSSGAKDFDQRVDSRTVEGFEDASNGVVEQEPRNTSNLGEAGVESDAAQDQHLLEDDGAHDNTEDQHMLSEAREVELPEDRCGSCYENEDECGDTGCSRQSAESCCSSVGDNS